MTGKPMTLYERFDGDRALPEKRRKPYSDFLDGQRSRSGVVGWPPHFPFRDRLTWRKRDARIRRLAYRRWDAYFPRCFADLEWTPIGRCSYDLGTWRRWRAADTPIPDYDEEPF